MEGIHINFGVWTEAAHFHIRCGRQKFSLQALWFVPGNQGPGEKRLVWAPPFPSGLISPILHSYLILLPPITVLPCTSHCQSHPHAIPSLALLLVLLGGFLNLPSPITTHMSGSCNLCIWIQEFFFSTLSHPNEHHQKCKRQTPGSPSLGAWPCHGLWKSAAETAREVRLELWVEPASGVQLLKWKESHS